MTVLPPGEWDPTIRIEPPKNIPSQEPRKMTKGRDHSDGNEELHGSDPGLMRTGRLLAIYFNNDLIENLYCHNVFNSSHFAILLHSFDITELDTWHISCLQSTYLLVRPLPSDSSEE